MHRLLTQTDVLYYVAFESNPKDQPSIARLSRAFFQSTAPLIWRRVDGVHNLLALIPAIYIKMFEKYPKCVDHMEYRRAIPRNFTRFSLYAPFVKYLEIYGQDATGYKFSGWRELGQYAKVAPLLPNLVQLTLTAYPIESQQQLMWMRTFLAPTTLGIQVFRPTVNNTPLMSMPAASNLLKHVSTVAPGVQRLSLFIQHEEYYQSEGDADVIGFWEFSPLQYYLGNLTALQELTCTEAALAPEVFSIIAQLPNLRVLNIYPIGRAYSVWASLNRKCVPLNPFPALEHFSMRVALTGDVLTVLGCLAFPNLSSLRLGIGQRPNPDYAIDDQVWEYEIVELIAEGCPHLKELRIDFDETHSYRELRNLLTPVGNGDTVKLMSKLPLETLYLSSATLGKISRARADPPYTAQYLMAAWPQVTKIHMPHFVGDFKRLYEFSQLPNLQELTLNLDLDYWNLHYDEEELENLNPGSSPLRVLGASYKTYISETLDDLIAPALLHFWPNLEQISLRLDPDDPDNDYSEILADIEEVNGAIKSFREARC